MINTKIWSFTPQISHISIFNSAMVFDRFQKCEKTFQVKVHIALKQKTKFIYMYYFIQILFSETD